MTASGSPAPAMLPRWVRVLPRLTAALTVAVGVLVLAGWGLRLPPLTSVVASLPAMMPTTAVAFVLAGAALWLLAPQHASPGRCWAGRGLALLVALVGLVVVGEYLAGWQPGLDRWLFADQLADLGMRYPGRPSPHTAVAFLLVGLALALLDADPTVQSMSTYGAAGSMKFAHAVPMHAIQVLAALAWLLSLSGLPQRRQAQLVALAVVGYAGLFGVALLRTTSGLAPVELLDASTLGYLLAAAFLAAPAVAAVAAITAHHRHAPS